MKTILNKTRRPLKIQLARGRVLRLGPDKEGQIATNDAEQETLQKMIEAVHGAPIELSISFGRPAGAVPEPVAPSNQTVPALLGVENYFKDFTTRD